MCTARGSFVNIHPFLGVLRGILIDILPMAPVFDGDGRVGTPANPHTTKDINPVQSRGMGGYEAAPR